MPLTQNDWRQFPTPCPQCAGVTGIPISVQSRTSAEVIVTMRCQHCKHEWCIHRMTPMLRPDRRRDDDGNEIEDR
jgi:hypothetical protein